MCLLYGVLRLINTLHVSDKAILAYIVFPRPTNYVCVSVLYTMMTHGPRLCGVIRAYNARYTAHHFPPLEVTLCRTTRAFAWDSTTRDVSQVTSCSVTPAELNEMDFVTRASPRVINY